MSNLESNQERACYWQKQNTCTHRRTNVENLHTDQIIILAEIFLPRFTLYSKIRLGNSSVRNYLVGGVLVINNKQLKKVA